MGNKNNLSWNQRFALIAKFNPNDETICTTFGVNQSELETARSLLEAHTFKCDSTGLNVDDYAQYFNTTVNPKSNKHSIASVTTPRSATKPIKVPKKRGKKGDKIIKAFTAIPLTPTSVNDFAASYGVSIPVLRQAKRFDKSGVDGRVKVKKDKESGNLMIWRETDA